MTSCLIVEDSIVVRDFLKKSLHVRFPTLYIVGVCKNDFSCQIISSLAPEIVLFSFEENVHYRRLLRQLRHCAARAAIIVLGDCGAPSCREAALTAGADSFLALRDYTDEAIETLLKQHMENRPWR